MSCNGEARGKSEHTYQLWKMDSYETTRESAVALPVSQRLGQVWVVGQMLQLSWRRLG